MSKYKITNGFHELFVVCHSHNGTTSRAPKNVWTKEEEGTLVECLVELVSMGDGNRIMKHSDQVT